MKARVLDASAAGRLGWFAALLWAGLLAGCSGGGGSSSAGTGPDNPSASVVDALLSTPETWVKVGETYAYLPVLADAVGAAAFRLDAGPAGMAIDPATGYLTWTPAAAQVGSHEVTLAAVSAGQEWSQPFVLTVSGETPLGQQTVGVAGGALTFGAVTVDVPAGAVGGAVTFAAAIQTDLLNTEPRTAVTILGEVVSLRAEDAAGEPVEAFDPPLVVRLSYDPADLPEGVAETELSAFLLDRRLQALAVYAESTVDTESHTVSFETPHLTDWFLGYPSRVLHTAIIDDGHFFVQYRDPVANAAEVAAYCARVLAAAQGAKQAAAAAGFSVPPGPVTIRVHDDAANGHYDPWSGIVYVDRSLADVNLNRSTAHEYFHKVQDQYYVINAAKITSKQWWFESTAPWFETKIDPQALQSRVDALAGGYLRTPLYSTDRNDAYPKSTLIEFLEGKSADFVQRTFADNAYTNTLLASVAKSVDLDALYPEYVNWALAKYGPGNGFGTVDGTIRVEESTGGVLFDNYSLEGAFQAGTAAGVAILAPDPVDGVTRITLRDRSAAASHRAFVYRIAPSTSQAATTKTVRVKFASTVAAPHGAFAVLTDRNGNPLGAEPVTPGDDAFYRIRRFGAGIGDRVGEIFLVYTDLSAGAGGMHEWQVEIVEQPAAADIEIDIPADEVQVSELRTFQPEEFAFPTLAVDTSADSGARSWAVLATGIGQWQSAPRFAAAWQVVGIPLEENPVVYGDPEIGTYNTARGFPGYPGGMPATGLNEFAAFQIMVGACDGDGTDYGCSFRGSNTVKYMDGPVRFSFVFDPPQVTPGHTRSDPYRFVPTTPVAVVLEVDNGSSLPVVLNSLQLFLTERFAGYSNTLKEPSADPFLVVEPGETKSYRIPDVVLFIDPDLYGTVQQPRLYVEVDNCPSGDAASCGLNDPALNSAAAFWADFFSSPATLEILAPPQ